MRENAAPQSQTHDDLYQREPFDYKPWRNFYELLGGTVALALLIGIGVVIFASDAPGYWQNIYITGVGAFLTVAILDRQAEHRAIRQRKEELILQMGSPDNGFAVEAARLLRLKGWLNDGSLKRANLSKADLRGVRFEYADLREVSLAGANLQGAVLAGADLTDGRLDVATLQGVQLAFANLTRAIATDADLQGVNLRYGRLQGAYLVNVRLRNGVFEYSDLKGTILAGADLRGANLAYAAFAASTILPDGSKWTRETDMTRFTDPNHPQFWRSDDPDSPAYRGKE